MSRERRVNVVQWWDQEGRAHTDRRTVKGAGSPASVPRDARAVDVCCPAGHLVAVLASGSPLVYIGGPLGPAPAFILRPEGIAPAVVSVEPDGTRTAGALGFPHASLPVDCHQCRAEWPLVALELDAARDRARPGRPARVTLGRAGSH